MLTLMLVSIGRTAKAPGDLVDLLLACHGRIKSFVELAEVVGGRQDLSTSETLEQCLRCERYFIEAFPLHVQDEELSLIPRLRGLDSGLDRALVTLQREHREHERALGRLMESSRSMREQPGDAVRRRGLATAASELAAVFAPHLELEETQVFPAVRARLSPAAQAEIFDELRSRRRSML